MQNGSLFQKQAIEKDLLAGFVVFLIAVPTSLGIAQSVNAPLGSGILAGIIGGILVGLLSGSHTSVSGPSPGLIGTVIAQLAILPSFEAFLVAVVIAGLLQIALGIARVGFLASFIPQDVVRGLLAALGILLILKQIPHLVGHDTNPEGELSFWQPDRQTTFSELLAMTGDFHLGPTVIGVLSVVILLCWDLKRPQRLGFLPGAVLVLLVSAGLHGIFQRIGGPWAIGPQNLVHVPKFLDPNNEHPLFAFPNFSFLTSPMVYVSASIIALVASLETMLNLQAINHVDVQRRRAPVNRELIAQGIGNATCGMLGGLPISALVIHSSVNINSDGQTKRATIFHGIFFLLFALFFPTILSRIPISALAAILFVTGIKLASPTLFRRMWESGRSQFAPFVITLVAIVLTDPLYGVLIGLGVSIAFILRDNMRRPLRRIVEKHLNEEVFHIELAPRSAS